MEEQILALLQQKKKGLAFHQIAAALRVHGRDQTNLRRALKVMEGRGTVLKQKDAYSLPRDKAVVRGEFLPSSRGFGFVRRSSGEGEDVFVPARHTQGALAGDIVEVVVQEKGKIGKPEGRIVRIVKKSRETLLGFYQEHYGRPMILPFDSASAEPLPLASRGTEKISPGMIIEAERDSLAVRHVFGFPEEPGVDIQVVVRRFNLATKFPEETQEEARRASRRIGARDREGRKDYRRWTTVTIDGESAQDFDDAVSIRRLPSGHSLLGVHIADVSHYVRPGSALDKEALARATSVYLPEFTIPMLPEELSNNVCSLRGRQVRLTVSVLLEIDGQGRIVKAEFHPSLIKTAERMTYTSVFKIFQGDEAETEALQEAHTRFPADARTRGHPPPPARVPRQPQLRPPRAGAYLPRRNAPPGGGLRGERSPSPDRGIHGAGQRSGRRPPQREGASPRCTGCIRRRRRRTSPSSRSFSSTSASGCPSRRR